MATIFHEEVWASKEAWRHTDKYYEMGPAGPQIYGKQSLAACILRTQPGARK